MRLRRFALFVAVASVDAGSKQGKSDRQFRQKKKQCEQTACPSLPADANANCVHACVSQTCYDEIYGEEPLEDGEVDSKRARAFSSCVRREGASGRKKKKRDDRAAEP
mmetsp:Transcript_34019/g.105275  ORF Transcript_34019/g.105275 Transcript_34019/m.105275 type:complete len:108 (+) Transcript_34019:843-1166(+)